MSRTPTLADAHLERQREIEDYWLMRLGMPRSSLRTSVVNVFSRSSKRTRIGKLPYGSSALCVHSTRIVQTIYAIGMGLEAEALEA